MNQRSTVVLLGLLVAGGLFWALRTVVTPTVPAIPTSVETIRATAAPEALLRLIVRVPGEVVILERQANSNVFGLPGGWPVREAEVTQLLDLFRNLDTRFGAIPITDDTDLSSFGLGDSQKPLVVELVTESGTTAIQFGEPPLVEGENPFARPTYLRIGQAMEVVRLGPDALPILTRPLSAYRKRQLFADTQRIKIGTSTRVIPGAEVDGVRITAPAESFTRKRLARLPVTDGSVTPNQLALSWEITAPVVDRLDPAALEQVLVSLPELWAEKFFTSADRATPEFMKKTGLEQPSRTVSVMRGNRVQTVLIGGPSRVVTRLVMQSIPSQQPGIPPQMREVPVRETYSYAQLLGNEQIFEIKETTFPQLFAQVSALRDSALVRFDPAMVRSIGVQKPGKNEVVLAFTKGDPKAELASKRPDRWDVKSPFVAQAESERVTELLGELSRMQAAPTERIDPKSDAEAVGAELLLGIGGPQVTQYLRGLDPSIATHVSITYEPIPGQMRTAKLLVGRESQTITPAPPPNPLNPMPPGAPTITRKAFVQVVGYPRVNRVSVDKLGEFLARDGLAYRSKRIFDLDDAVVEQLDIRFPNERYTLAIEKVPELSWRLTQPVSADADNTKTAKLASDLIRLEALEYIAENPTPEQLKAYGLENPTSRVKVRFTDVNIPSAMIDIGQPQPETGNYFAMRVGRTTVFTMPKALVEELMAGSLTFRPLVVWTGTEPQVEQIVVQRPDQVPYTLQRDMMDWKLTTPYMAPVGVELLGSMVVDFANVKAERWQAHTSDDLAPFGLDANSKPLSVKVTMQTSEPAGAGNPPKLGKVERTLLIGKTTGENASSRFATLVGSPGVFTINDALARAVDKDPLELIERRLLTYNPLDITKVQMATSSGNVTLLRDGGNKWKTEGGTPFSVDVLTIEELLNRFAGLRAERFVAYGPNLDRKKFDLDASQMPLTFTLTTGGEKPQTYTITLSSKSLEDGQRHATVGQTPGIALVAIPRLPTGPLDFVERTLWKIDPLEIITLTRKGTDKALSLESSGSVWDMIVPKKEPADTLFMDELLESLSRLRAERIAALAPKSLKEFGLDMPIAEWQIAYGSKLRTIKIGTAIPKSEAGEHYATIDGSDVVAVLPGGLSKRLLAEPAAFRDRTLANFVTADKIIMETPLRKLMFTKGAGAWNLSEPTAGAAEDTTLRELHDALARLRAEEIVKDAPTPEELKAFGLDPPAMRWKLYDGDKLLLDLLVGKREGFRAYAKRAKSNIVVLLDPSVTARLSAEYRKRTLFTNLDVALADSLSYSSAGGGYEFRKVQNVWKDVDMPQAKIDADKMSDTLDALASLRVERFVEDDASDAKLKEYGLNPPRETVTLTMKGSKQVVELGRYEGDSKRVYAHLPDQSAVFVLSEIDTARILRGQSGFQRMERELIPVPPKEIDAKK